MAKVVLTIEDGVGENSISLDIKASEDLAPEHFPQSYHVADWLLAHVKQHYPSVETLTERYERLHGERVIKLADYLPRENAQPVN